MTVNWSRLSNTEKAVITPGQSSPPYPIPGSDTKSAAPVVKKEKVPWVPRRSGTHMAESMRPG